MASVIAAIDGSSLAKAVQDGAIWAAGILQTPIKFVHALEKESLTATDNYSGAIGLGAREQLQEKLAKLDGKHSKIAYEQGQALLTQAKQYAQDQQISAVDIEQRHGELIETLEHYSQQAQLIVLGHKGESHYQEAHSIGSHLANALRTLTCPLLVTVEPFIPPTSFMIAYDGRETADQLVNFVSKQPLLKTLQAHIVLVGDKNLSNEQKLANAQRLLADHGFTSQTAVITNDYNSIADSLLEYQRQHAIGMLAMGAFATKGLRRFFVGTNTTKVISKTQVPVLVMK